MKEYQLHNLIIYYPVWVQGMVNDIHYCGSVGYKQANEVLGLNDLVTFSY